MDKRHHILDWLTNEFKESIESVPGQALIEIVGGQRVLIENHFGICAYYPNEILVKVRSGCISVCGQNLEIAKMTKEQLVIRGIIEVVALHRR